VAGSMVDLILIRGIHYLGLSGHVLGDIYPVPCLAGRRIAPLGVVTLLALRLIWTPSFKLRNGFIDSNYSDLGR